MVKINLEISEQRIVKEAPFFVNLKLDLILKFIKGPEVLDAGCGLGKIAIPLAKRGFIVTGLDLSKNLIGIGKKRAKQKNLEINFIDGDLKNVKLNKKFDTILLADVLEHINDDVSILRKLSSYLKPSGRIIAIVPAFEFLRCPRDNVVGHLRRYTKKEIKIKFENAGIKIEKLSYWKFIIIFPALWSKLFKEKEYSAYKALNKISIFLLKVWFKLIEEKMFLPIGESLFVIGEKN